MPVNCLGRAAAIAASSGQTRAVVLRVRMAHVRTTSQFWARMSGGGNAVKPIITSAPVLWLSRVPRTVLLLHAIHAVGSLAEDVRGICCARDALRDSRL